MKGATSIQERLWELRKDKGLVVRVDGYFQISSWKL